MKQARHCGVSSPNGGHALTPEGLHTGSALPAESTHRPAPVSLKIAWQTSGASGVTLSVYIRLTTLFHFLHNYFMKAELNCGTVHLRESGASAPGPRTTGLELRNVKNLPHFRSSGFYSHSWERCTRSAGPYQTVCD